MKKQPIYTIGHGNRKPEDFLQLLNKFGIQYLIDVRSLPYSKFNPQYNQTEMRFFLERHGIKYVFMGDNIGGRPKDQSCYDFEGKVDYDILQRKEFFIEGIARLKTAFLKGLNVCLMCSESDPCECHRSKLIGRVLLNDKVILEHIDEFGKLKDQVTVINILNKGLSDVDLFGNRINSTSRKSYI
jgi:uncharacterized protein (DUF488 family)